jgi:hypothetical protein
MYMILPRSRNTFHVNMVPMNKRMDTKKINRDVTISESRMYEDFFQALPNRLVEQILIAMELDHRYRFSVCIGVSIRVCVGRSRHTIL